MNVDREMHEVTRVQVCMICGRGACISGFVILVQYRKFILFCHARG